jgi:DNA-binding transcriptional LysR family regulator
MLVVARVGHPLARKKALRLPDLAEHPWILPPPGMPYRLRLDAAFRRGGKAPPIDLVESTCILANKTLLQETDRIGVMPADVARHYEGLGLLQSLAVEVPPPSGPVGAILEEGRSRTKALTALLDALREVADAQTRA